MCTKSGTVSLVVWEHKQSMKGGLISELSPLVGVLSSCIEVYIVAGGSSRHIQMTVTLSHNQLLSALTVLGVGRKSS